VKDKGRRAAVEWPNEQYSFSKLVALIAGSNTCIGREIVRQLGKNHGMTVLIGARDEARGREASDKLMADGVDARPLRLDVTDPVSVEAAAGGLKASVTAAGCGRGDPRRRVACKPWLR
jgi:NAD(P)-dependent dehydrogenase (short-subunit alcohol dehydrogenase family)